MRSAWARVRTGERVEFSGAVWAGLVGVLVAFILLIELVANLNDIHGPLYLLGRDFIGRPRIGEIKMAGLLLALICMPSRLRLPVLGSAVALELIWNSQRWIVGHPGTIGNGILFVLVGTAAFAAWRLHGAERATTLKAVGLGMLLITMGRVGDVWLVLSTKASPEVLDEYVELADRALGSPAWAFGTVVSDHAWMAEILSKVYVYLPVGAAIIAFFQLRNSARDGFPRHHIIRTFLLIGLIGPVVYFLFPVVGPTYAFGHEMVGAGWQDVWPLQLPVIGDPESLYFNQIIARNCMPSLHTAWAMSIFLHGWRGSRAAKVFGTVWLFCTISATLGFGFHYAIDVLAGIIFTLTLEAALTRPELGWGRHRVSVIAFGAAAFTGMLLATRYLAVEMSTSGVLGGVSLIVVVLAMAGAFLTIELHPGRGEFAGPPLDVGDRRSPRELVHDATRTAGQALAAVSREAEKTTHRK